MRRLWLAKVRCGLSVAFSIAVLAMFAAAGAEQDKAGAPPVPEQDGWFVTAEKLNVRAAPSGHAAVLGVLERNSRIEVVNRNAGSWPWVQIKWDSNGETAWVNEDFIELRSPYSYRHENRVLCPDCPIFYNVINVDVNPKNHQFYTPEKPAKYKQWLLCRSSFEKASYTLFALGENRSFVAVAGKRVAVENPMTGMLVYTPLIFSNPEDANHDFFVAATGANYSYAPIVPKAILDKDIIESADKTARVEKKVFANWTGEGTMDVVVNKIEAFKVDLSFGPAVLMRYEGRRTADVGQTYRLAALVWNGKAVDCSPLVGNDPALFRLNGKDYMWSNMSGGSEEWSTCIHLIEQAHSTCRLVASHCSF